MRVYRFAKKVSEIAFPPEKCAGCGKKFKEEDTVFCYQDEQGADLIPGWYCSECMEYVEGEEFADDEIIAS